MLKTIVVLPDGTEISSGANTQNAIKTVKITECVNSGEDLILGSTCANALEATLFTPSGGLSLEAGMEVTVYKDDGTTRLPVGVFILEKPTRPSANAMKITGYDRVSKLDKDLSAWLSGLGGWPYALTTFADMVCAACGLTYKESEVPNADFQVQQFTRASVTGRQIMRWLGEICARFCRATPEGEIEFAWYTDSGKTITTGGELYYLQNGLSYEDYETAKISAVQIRLANSDDGALWPEVEDDTNSYIITDNAILNLQITNIPRSVFANIHDAISDVAYTPCKVSIPANLDIHAGNTVRILDKNGKEITTYVMTKTQSGQKDTLEGTGNYRRNTTTAENTKPVSEQAAEAVQNQTWKDLFGKWTNGGKIQGIFSNGEVWVFNAAVAQIINLVANCITSGILKSKDGKTYFDLDSGSFVSSGVKRTVSIYEGEQLFTDDIGRILAWIGDVGSSYGLANLFGFQLYGCDSLSNNKYLGGLLAGEELTIRAVNLDESARTLEDHRVGWKTIDGQRYLVAFD